MVESGERLYVLNKGNNSITLGDGIKE
jgi:hypothetical protein